MRRAAVAMTLGLALTSCETLECTELGCIDQVRLEFTPGTLAPGSYELTARAGEATVFCTFTLPGEASLRVVCDDPMAAVQLRADGLGSFDFPGSPAELSLELRRDGLLVETLVVRPDYVTVHPNGEDCPGECLQSTEELPLGG